jgi:hypothetical protein
MFTPKLISQKHPNVAVQVSLASMADEFGVSHTYMDAQLHTLVAGGRLHCRIDAVRGIVETIRADNKNDSYKSVIRYLIVLEMFV